MSGNKAFFSGERKSPWLMVAYGMVGASLSGVSFVSVPGMVITSDMTYLQTCLGFIFGYLFVAYVLLPVYYRQEATTIYHVLGDNRTLAALFFVLSDLLGSSVRFYLACSIIQFFVFDKVGVPFEVSVPLMVFFMWLYTRKSGIKVLVYTDVIMTTLMLAALFGILYTLRDVVPLVWQSPHFRVFEFEDFVSTQNFFKQFLSGIFIVIVMTGLNQNMMQKNLTCKTLKDAQKDMTLSGFLFVPVNLLFLVLGIALVVWTQQNGLALPGKGDELLPLYVRDNASLAVTLFFLFGIVSAAFSSADSTLTSLTTSLCVDIVQKPDSERLRKWLHKAVATVFVAIVFVLRYVGSGSLIDVIYILASYTYGPLLGLFAYNFSKRGSTKKTQTRHALTVLVCVFAPVLCYVLNQYTVAEFNYKFGYELLLLNGLLTFIGLKMVNR